VVVDFVVVDFVVDGDVNPNSWSMTPSSADEAGDAAADIPAARDGGEGLVEATATAAVTPTAVTALPRQAVNFLVGKGLPFGLIFLWCSFPTPCRTGVPVLAGACHGDRRGYRPVPAGTGWRDRRGR
jgi:hypothetical protein